MTPEEKREADLKVVGTFIRFVIASILILSTTCAAGFGAGYAIGVERGHEMRAADEESP